MDDAVQEAWLKTSRSDASDVDNLGGWLTTIVGRVCLDMLRVIRGAKGRRRTGAHVQPALPERLAHLGLTILDH